MVCICTPAPKHMQYCMVGAEVRIAWNGPSSFACGRRLSLCRDICMCAPIYTVLIVCPHCFSPTTTETDEVEKMMAKLADLKKLGMLEAGDSEEEEVKKGKPKGKKGTSAAASKPAKNSVWVR